nr:RNA polymerase sigma-70 factor [Parabacteroides leei]
MKNHKIQQINSLETQRCFSQIYSTYFTKMIRFSQAYVIAEEDAENIVQDIFLYLWEHPEVFKTIDNMDAFLFTLVKNRCLNFLKHSLYVNEKKSSIQTVEELEMQMNLYSLQQFDESFLTISDVENLINEVIDKLPERCKEIFILSRMEGLKYKEIAERLNISVNTVENQMSIALRKLKIELKDYLPLLLFIL